MLPSDEVLPSSFGAPTNTLLSIMHTPRPKSSFSEIESDANMSSKINFELYIVAVNAAPEPVFMSTMLVSCRSKVVSPESNFISRLEAKFSEPITSLVPSSFISSVVPNLMFSVVSGNVIVCCKVYVLLDASAFHL